MGRGDYIRGKKRPKDVVAKGVETRMRNGSYKWTDAQRELARNRKGPLAGGWRGGIATPERKRWHNANRRAARLGSGGSHTEDEWENLKEEYGYACLRCGKAEPEIMLTRDHIVPISRGGRDDIQNIQPLCRSCNGSKFTRDTNYKCLFTNAENTK